MDTARPSSARPVGRWWLLAKVAVTTTLLAVLVGRADWAQMGGSLAQLRPVPMVVAILAFGTIVLLETARLRTALSSFALSWTSLLRLHVVSLFFGSFLPGQLGADLFKVVSLRSTSGSTFRPLAVVLFLRLLGLAVLLAAALGTVLVQGRTALGPFDWKPGPEARVVAFLLLGLLALLAHPTVRSGIVKILGRHRERIQDVAGSLDGRQMAVLTGLSWLIVGARALVLSSLVRGVGDFRITAAEALLVVTLATLSTLIPVSVAGLGVRESVVALLLVEATVPYEAALLVALLGRTLMLLVAATGGVWLLRESARSRGQS